MKAIYIFCFLLGCGMMLMCKPDSGVSAEASGQIAEGVTKSEGHDYTFLTHELFHFKASFGGKKENGDPLFKDEWIDLEPNGTYKAGHLKKQTHTGLWTYNHGTQILFLKPNASNFKMSEWKVMHNDQMMVWVGTSTYEDNATQVQLIRMTELPSGSN